MLYLVAYDIRNARRLNAVAKFCLRYGVRVGLSVFEMRFDRRIEFEYFLEELSSRMDTNIDLIRIYRICENCLRERRILGKSTGENTILREGCAYVF